MHTFEPRWAPPRERPQVGVHMDRYNMSHLILLRASCISAFSQSHDDKSPLLARGGPWAPVSCTFTFMLAGAHMRIRRYIQDMYSWRPGPRGSRFLSLKDIYTWRTGPWGSRFLSFKARPTLSSSSGFPFGGPAQKNRISSNASFKENHFLGRRWATPRDSVPDHPACA